MIKSRCGNHFFFGFWDRWRRNRACLGSLLVSLGCWQKVGWSSSNCSHFKVHVSLFVRSKCVRITSTLFRNQSNNWAALEAISNPESWMESSRSSRGSFFELNYLPECCPTSFCRTSSFYLYSRLCAVCTPKACCRWCVGSWCRMCIDWFHEELLKAGSICRALDELHHLSSRNPQLRKEHD